MKIVTNENFENLLEESLSKLNLKPGAVLQATIVKIMPDYVIVDAGLKTEDMIPIQEFRGEEINPGDIIEVAVDTIENGFGETRLSREKARRARAWVALEKAHKERTTVEGTIVERVKGGFIIDLDGVFGFLPGSQADIKPVRDPSYLEDKSLPFKIIKIDYRRNNVVVSRRAVLEQGGDSERVAKLDELQEGLELVGIVKNITDYGAFVDLGGIDGLLHVTDISWKRIKHPSEALKMGDEVRVKILKFDRDKNRVSLGIKQLSEDPWQDIIRRYPVGSRLFGHVTNITDYGCFVELQEGVEGLVHMSEMDWTNKNVHPSKVVKPGQEVEVMVLEIDEDRRRISLGIKQCQSNPWKDFAANHEAGEKIKGKIRSITDFGIFLGLEGEIDGLIHLSDISWTAPAEEALKAYKKGDEIEAQILAIDSDRERISLGIKQLTADPMEGFLKEHPENSVIKGKITEVTPKQAKLDLGDNIIGLLKASEFSHEKFNDLTEVLKVDEEIETKILRVDRKSRAVMLSIKALHSASSAEASKTAKKTKSASTADTSKVTLGDLLKEQMKKDEEAE